MFKEIFLYFKGCMKASEVKKVFNSSAQLIGDRECKFLGTSALKG